MAVYHLQSSLNVCAPQTIAWGVNGFHFEEDRQHLMDIIAADFPSVPRVVLERVLSRKLDYRVEGQSVIFTVEDENEHA
ncbi:hypothetical protein [uncultured Paracoccus sp.]|uniref:hypothetical protein n=1 Tax=uncultured Paracoccus sp. TaxID=189685 RepID=UPI0026129706|nr:hypothetical protein [uncultured Paracoccus sp.]